jgi:hypothetical protein
VSSPPELLEGYTMKLLTLATACAAVATLCAAPALAGEPITAKLQQPVAEKTKFIAGGAMFVCEADACTAIAPSSQTFGASTCKTIAAKVGLVAAFGGARSLDDAKLGECNAVALARTASGPMLARQ